MRGSFMYPIRTPLGRMGHAFASIRPTDLVAHPEKRRQRRSIAPTGMMREKIVP